MKLVTFVCLGMIAVAARAQVVLHDRANGVSLIYERSGKASIVVKETWSMPGSARIVESTYSEAGALMKRMVAITRGRTSARSEAIIDATGATLVSGGRTAHIALQKKLDVIDPSVLWFVKEKPADGATTAFMSFDPQYRYWEEVTVAYAGKNTVTRKGARGTVRIVFDEKGSPISWEEGRYKLTRG